MVVVVVAFVEDGADETVDVALFLEVLHAAVIIPASAINVSLLSFIFLNNVGNDKINTGGGVDLLHRLRLKKLNSICRH